MKLYYNLESKKQNKIINIKDCNSCKYKEYKKQIQVLKKIFNIANLEQKRKSVLTDELCSSKKDNFT